ncbi:MAG: hypothetical protein K6G84_05960 [Lachnospiraceae bacterium]|nr:hypothetical protein [Lachnospiraceae bacterium]
MRSRFREQKHICGNSYDTAAYMEVDLYQISEKEHKQSIRAKRRKATELAQQCYNESRAKRYHVQLVNTNFKEGDFSLTCTYDDDHLPAPEDQKRADDDWSNYMKRLYRYCKKNNIKRPKWVMATEYATLQEDGEYMGRHHHHAIVEKTEELTRDILEDLWVDRNGDKLGMCHCDRLEVTHGSVESLVKYISKNKRCDRSWRQSRGLKKPITPKPNDSKWSRKKFDEAATLYVDDKDFWAKQYPGYTLERVETKVSDTGYRHTLVIMYRSGTKPYTFMRRRD